MEYRAFGIDSPDMEILFRLSEYLKDVVREKMPPSLLADSPIPTRVTLTPWSALPFRIASALVAEETVPSLGASYPLAEGGTRSVDASKLLPPTETLDWYRSLGVQFDEVLISGGS